MSLQQIQALLARMYTDAALRERFFSEPDATGRDFGLTEDEIQQLQALSQPQTRAFAHGLVHKRMGQVQKLMPATSTLIQARFSRHFHAFAETCVPDGVRKHKDDAQRFAMYLRHDVEEPLPPWLCELIAFESDWISAMHPKTRLQVRWYRHPVEDIHAAAVLREGDVPLDEAALLAATVPRCWTLACWWRTISSAPLRFKIISWPRVQLPAALA